MKLNSKEFKKICITALSAVDASELDSLELKTVGNILFLNVTNRRYFLSAKFCLQEAEPLHVVINASKFLKLIAAITADEISLVAHESYLSVKANGNYKIAYAEGITELPMIDLGTTTVDMTIPGDTLDSILTYNSREFLKPSKSPMQKLYYLDQEGCITRTTSVCVNNFKLEKPFTVLLDNKLVKLFKLFKGVDVAFKLGYTELNNTTQTTVSFETPTITLTAITPSDDTLLTNFQASLCRNLANKLQPHTVVVKTSILAEALNRLYIFASNQFFADITATIDELTITSENNTEIVMTSTGSNVTADSYKMTINIETLKNIVDSCTEQYITLSFGDHRGVVITRGAIQNVIPEALRS